MDWIYDDVILDLKVNDIIFTIKYSSCTEHFSYLKEACGTNNFVTDQSKTITKSTIKLVGLGLNEVDIECPNLEWLDLINRLKLIKFDHDCSEFAKPCKMEFPYELLELITMKRFFNALN